MALSWKRRSYHFKEKPVHAPPYLLALNEATATTINGVYKNTNVNIVIKNGKRLL
jgi:hypothetical protein